MTALAPAALDVSGTRDIGFGRLVGVEVRKMADTRAGRWLLISIAALTALVLIIQMSVVVAQDLDVTFLDFLMGTNTPMGILLPVLGVMTVTSEWSQRTAMVTFTLEPARSRVIAAKLVACVIVAFAALVLGYVLGIVANVLYGSFSGHDLVWGKPLTYLCYLFLVYVFSMLTGFAFGALLLNSAAGIVVYFVYSFVLPTLFAIGAELMHWFARLQPWIDFNNDQNNLLNATMSGRDWVHLTVSGLIWLVLPLAIGVWRIQRAEVK
jgi:ABC-2 type transport system permease protein